MLLRHASCAIVAMVWTLGPVNPARAETTILYSNDFETPNEPVAVTCGNSLDQEGINVLFGSPDFQFSQQNTVEVVLLTDPAGLYQSQAGHAGAHAIGMLSAVEDDKLALTFDARMLPFVNVGMDVSAIDVEGCGGPFGVAVPSYRISLLDSPGGAFDWSNPLLDEKVLTGSGAAQPWSFHWSKSVVGLSTRGTQDGHVSIVFDLTSSGYAVFDNLSITASTMSQVVDLDLDGVSDETDNCPTDQNDDQTNDDADRAGDACDPAPADPAACGDQNHDGSDDCDPDAALPDAGAPDPADASVTGPEPDAAASEPDADTSDASTGASQNGGGSGCACSISKRPATSRPGLALFVLGSCVALWQRARRRRG